MSGYFGNVPQAERPEREVERMISRSHPSPNAAAARKILSPKWTGLREARREGIAARLH